jgi:type II secretory pathway component PulK
LIIVLWVTFGLVSLALYFAHSMSMELRAADNRCASIQASAAIQGAVRYVTNLLATVDEPGMMPDPMEFKCEGVPVGEAQFWVLGRSDRQIATDQAVFGLADECAKIDLNSATASMLEMLPLMTPEIAAAIVDWRDADSDVSSNGAEDEVYLRLNPAYRCKNAPFESVEELRMVRGMTLEILYGEDTNLNGVLDPNENDGDESMPADNRDGRLDSGLMECLTVHTRPGTMGADGVALIDVSRASNTNLLSLLSEKLGAQRANQIRARLTAAGSVTNLLQFYASSGMTAEEFTQIESLITVSSAGTNGLVNVNTAPEAVLVCLPGIGTEKASSLVARRQSNPVDESSIAWVTEVLEPADIQQAGPYLTGRTYQYSVDVAAVGRYGRGWQRVRFVVDTAEGAPKIVARRDLSSLGWALGQNVRTTLLSANTVRR